MAPILQKLILNRYPIVSICDGELFQFDKYLLNFIFMY